MELNLKKPMLNLTKLPNVAPLKFQDGKYTRTPLATSKKQALAAKVA